MQNDTENKPNNDDSDSAFRAHLFQLYARISTIAIETVVPALLGFGIDYLLNTFPFFIIVGAITGVALGFWQLLKIAQFDDPKK